MLKKEQMINKGNSSRVLTSLLKYNVVEVMFTKVNGEPRKMNCTKAFHIIPEDKHPTGNNAKELNEAVVRVYDVEADGWRSFRADSVTAFRSISRHEEKEL
jgi:hypothetical protein